MIRQSFERPHFHVHFTPTYGLVERWFAELTNKHIRRGVFRSFKGSESAIRKYISVHNEAQNPSSGPGPRIKSSTASRDTRGAQPLSNNVDLSHEPLGQETRRNSHKSPRCRNNEAGQNLFEALFQLFAPARP